jgi:ABC-type nitrate/sulfonate/bicarbonate transport system substrate-binding protein
MTGSRTASLLLALLIVAFLAMPGRAAAANPANMRIALTAYSSSNWQIFAAVKRGFFKQENLNVEVIILRSSLIQTQALLANDIHMNTYSIDSAAKPVLQGAPLKLIGASQEKPSFRAIVAKDIKGWSDLKGKTLAAGTPGGAFYTMFATMLAVNGIKKGDYSYLSIGRSGDRISAMKAGQIQGCLIGQPDDFVLLDDGFKSLGFTQDYLKDVQYAGFTVNGKWAEKNEETLVATMRALVRATKWLHDPANKKEAMAVLLDYFPDWKPSWQEQTYDMLIRQKMLSADARPNMKGIENFLKLAVEHGGITSVPPLETWVDRTYVEKASP